MDLRTLIDFVMIKRFKKMPERIIKVSGIKWKEGIDFTEELGIIFVMYKLEIISTEQAVNRIDDLIEDFRYERLDSIFAKGGKAH